MELIETRAILEYKGSEIFSTLSILMSRFQIAGF
jgi:hypothetical protein